MKRRTNRKARVQPEGATVVEDTYTEPKPVLEFQVGDRVATRFSGHGIIRDVIADGTLSPMYLVDHFQAGELFHDGCGNGDGKVRLPKRTGWWYYGGGLTKVETRNGFAVGDRVERINCPNHTTVPVGARGTVAKLNDSHGNIEVHYDGVSGDFGYSNSPENLRNLTVEGVSVETDVFQAEPAPTIEEEIRKEWPHGHPQFAELTIGELKLHSEKNHDYAAGGDPLGNFKRVAAILAMYPGLKLDDPAIVAVVYAMKQVDAYLWMKSNGHTAKVEGTGERLGDVSIYSKLARILDATK